MKEFIVPINTDGQVTIPTEVCNYLGLQTNDNVVFVIVDNGAVYMKAPRYPNISSLRGAAGSLKQKLTKEQIQQIAQEDCFDAKKES